MALKGKESTDRHADVETMSIYRQMKALLAEYTICHDPELAPEGRSMVSVIAGSFERCGYEVVMPGSGDFNAEIERLAPECDVGLVIAPDELLPRFTRTLESRTRNLGCDSLAAAVCASKRKSGAILSANGIDVPPEVTSGVKVVKPDRGCGALHMRITDDAPGAGELGQQYVDGDHMSVSLVAGRLVGEACLYYSGLPPLLLALNRQHIEIRDGQFLYLGGETPAGHPRAAEIVETAKRAVSLLGCQGYAGIDLVVGERIWVVDVNPRMTSSIVGIAAIMEEEIADILVRASYGDVPAEVHLRGHASFDKDGAVTIR
jgi:predicted ATP-grasp superfamily ATP-dependent carboligase